MIFEAHGVFEVKVEGRLLLVDATGPFNEELIGQYKKALESCIQHLESAPWHQIITLHDTSIFTPDAEKALTRTLIDRKARGLLASAVVMQSGDYKTIVQDQMSRSYRAADVHYQFFSSIVEAHVWVKQFASASEQHE